MRRADIEAMLQEIRLTISGLQELDLVLRHAAEHVAGVSDRLQDLHQRTAARLPGDDQEAE